MSDHDRLCYRHAEGKRRPLIDCDCRIITLARADERENGNWVTPYRDALMRALRTQMEALPRWRMDDTLVQVVAYEDVLALIARSGGKE